jgi:hypothetical protein
VIASENTPHLPLRFDLFISPSKLIVPEDIEIRPDIPSKRLVFPEPFFPNIFIILAEAEKDRFSITLFIPRLFLDEHIEHQQPIDSKLLHSIKNKLP